MAINVPIVSQFVPTGVEKAVKEFQNLETTGQKVGMALEKASTRRKGDFNQRLLSKPQFRERHGLVAQGYFCFDPFSKRPLDEGDRHGLAVNDNVSLPGGVFH